MIGFCEIEGKIGVFLSPQQKVGTGTPIPTIFFLVYYDNIMKHLDKF